MKKIFFLVCLIFSSPTIVLSEAIEIHALDQLDDDRGFCLDIRGHKSKASINKGLQAHTCYSYQGEIAVDQGFDSLQITKNQFFLPAFDVCMEATSISISAPLQLNKCNFTKLQKFKFSLKGRINPIGHSELCLTIAQGKSKKGRGGSPVHLKRNLTLEPCSNALDPYQIWSARKRN